MGEGQCALRLEGSPKYPCAEGLNSKLFKILPFISNLNIYIWNSVVNAQISKESTSLKTFHLRPLSIFQIVFSFAMSFKMKKWQGIKEE